MVKYRYGWPLQTIFYLEIIHYEQRTFLILILVETMVVLNNSSTCTLMDSVEFP